MELTFRINQREFNNLRSNE